MHLGNLNVRKGKYEEAWRELNRASRMDCDLAEPFVAESSEAEALDYLSRLPSTSGYLVSCAFQLKEAGEATYVQVWRTKGAVARILRRRQASLAVKAGADPNVRKLVDAWNKCRLEISRSILGDSNGANGPDRIQQVQRLTAEKENLERRLSAALPEFKHERAVSQASHGKLLEALPEKTVVIDLVQCPRFKQDPQHEGNQRTRIISCYAGFVLTKGQPVQMVDLGPAQPIDDAVKQWRKAIAENQPGSSDKVLQQDLWKPLARRFPPGTKTVLIAPDGLLTAIPWSALPGEQPGTLLLEQYALAIVPHAPFVLDMLTAPPRAADASSTVLVVGGIPISNLESARNSKP